MDRGVSATGPDTDDGQHHGSRTPDEQADPDADLARHRKWRVERIETEPMTTEQHDNAVRALAALIATWRETTTRNNSQQPRDQAA